MTNNRIAKLVPLSAQEVKRLSHKLKNWSRKLPMDEEGMLNYLLSAAKGKTPNKIEDYYLGVSVDQAVKTFFEFIPPKAAQKVVAWMETPEPPWPRWHDTWNVCYWAGPPTKMRLATSENRDESKNSFSEENPCSSLAKKLDSYAQSRDIKEKHALIAIILFAMHPTQRMRLIEPSVLLNSREQKTLSNLEESH